MDILIVEDESLAVQKLIKLLNSSACTTRVAGVTDGIESTVAWLNANPQPDLILMDIELADGQSFEIFNLVSITCPVVFTTSYNESAIQSFRGNSLDYLLKPIKKEELDQILAKYQQAPEVKPVTSSETPLDPTSSFRLNDQFVIQARSAYPIHPQNGQYKVDSNPTDALVSGDRANEFNQWLSR